MFIQCVADNNYERFYIPNVKTMEEIKKYAKDNIPIECFLLGGRCKNSIYLKEYIRFTHLYLNNYLYYYEIDGYISEPKRINELNKTTCNNCCNRDAVLDGCKFIKGESELSCENFKEKPIRLFGRLFSKISS